MKRLRVLGTPRRLVGLRGFGLEVEGHEEPAGIDPAARLR